MQEKIWKSVWMCIKSVCKNANTPSHSTETYQNPSSRTINISPLLSILSPTEKSCTSHSHVGFCIRWGHQNMFEGTHQDIDWIIAAQGTVLLWCTYHRHRTSGQCHSTTGHAAWPAWQWMKHYQAKEIIATLWHPPEKKTVIHTLKHYSDIVSDIHQSGSIYIYI